MKKGILEERSIAEDKKARKERKLSRSLAGGFTCRPRGNTASRAAAHLLLHRRSMASDRRRCRFIGAREAKNESPTRENVAPAMARPPEKGRRVRNPAFAIRRALYHRSGFEHYRAEKKNRRNGFGKLRETWQRGGATWPHLGFSSWRGSLVFRNNGNSLCGSDELE